MILTMDETYNFPINASFTECSIITDRNTVLPEHQKLGTPAIIKRNYANVPEPNAIQDFALIRYSPSLFFKSERF